MPYFPVDDQAAFHPKMVAAGNAAVGLWTRAGSWCKAHTSGGFVPAEIALALGSRSEIKRLLVALWEPATHPIYGDGYQFHDWNHQAGNFDADEEKARREVVREKDRERKRAQREREKAERHAGHTDGHGVTPGGIPSTPSPVPSPLTDVTNFPESSHLGDAPTSGLDSVFIAAKQAGIHSLPAVQRMLEQATGQPVSMRGAVLLSTAIAAKSKNEIRKVDSYVRTVCQNSPAEVQQAYFDLDVAGLADPVSGELSAVISDRLGVAS